MTQEQMQALMARYQADATFKAALDAAASVQDAVQVAVDHGFTVAVADFTSASPAQDRDVSDDELEGQSGGEGQLGTWNWMTSDSHPCPVSTSAAWAGCPGWGPG